MFSKTSDNQPANLRKQAITAFIIYLLSACAILGHVFYMQTPSVLGHCESDLWKHMWDAWWMGQELSQGNLPTFTYLQNYPYGGTLYIIDPLNAAFAALFTPILGLAGAYNLTIICQVLAAAMACWALAAWITKDGRAALIAGMGYGFCPFILSSGISSGIAETSNLAWLPLAILGLLMGFSNQNGYKSVLLGAVGLALSALGSWYFGMTAMVFGILLGLHVAINHNVPVPTPGKINWGYPIAACLVAAVLMSPIALFFAKSLKGDSSLLGRVDVTERQESNTIEFFHKAGNFKNNADLVSFFTPGKDKISVAQDVDRRMKSSYIGLMICILACLGLWKGGRWTRFWGISGLIVALLAAGPYLYVAPGVGLPKPWNPLYMLSFYVIPGFRLMAISDRLCIAVQMCACILACAGLKFILPPGRRGTLLAALAAVLVLGETAWLSPVPMPIPVSPTTYPSMAIALQKETKEAGIIQLPLNRVNNELQPGEYYYWQTCHHKPMPITLTTRFPTAMMENRLIGTLYLCESADYGLPPRTSALAPGLVDLQKNGFAWIGVNTSLLREVSVRKICLILNELLGKPQRFDDGSLLYDLNSPTALENTEKGKKAAPIGPQEKIKPLF